MSNLLDKVVVGPMECTNIPLPMPNVLPLLSDVMEPRSPGRRGGKRGREIKGRSTGYDDRQLQQYYVCVCLQCMCLVCVLACMRVQLRSLHGTEPFDLVDQTHHHNCKGESSHTVCALH